MVETIERNWKPMSQDPQQDMPEENASRGNGSSQQQQQQPQDGHAGQGSESIMKELREWESRRASNSGGKRRNGPA
jgi:hypothetical protein